MSDPDWFDLFGLDAFRAGDVQRFRMSLLHHDAFMHRESDPDYALALIAEGRHLAEELRKAWWALYYDHYRVHALLHFKQDYRDVLDLAVRNTLEVGKPPYVDFPRRIRIYDDLISAYAGIDPLGYAEQIRQALDYLDREVPSFGEDRYMLLGGLRQFAVEMGDLAAAETAVRQSLALSADDDDRGMAQHFAVFTYAGLAEIAWRRDDWAVLRQTALAGEEAAREVGHTVELAEFLLWQALLAQHDGNTEQARRLFRLSKGRILRSRMPADVVYFDVECAYHERCGQPEQAVRVREEELAAVGGKGRLWAECQCHLKRCRLRAKFGQLTPDDLDRACAAALRLRKPEGPLGELARLSPGGAR